MKEKVLNKLNELNISYKEIEHTPVYTIEDMDNLGDVFENAKICKNLFVRDQKGKRHFLVVLPEEKRAHNCIDCKKCMEHCPQEINIPRKLSNIKELTK